MDIMEYQKNAIRTESVNFADIKQRLDDDCLLRILHGAIGVVTEAGEFFDAIKKHVFYGAELDLVNLGEEMGDLMWYLAVIADALKTKTDIDFPDWLQRNIEKLRVRYPEKFTEDKAAHRTLDKEREVLEGNKE